MKVRKNQKQLRQSEWDDFIEAFRALREGILKGVDKPTMDDFADEHAKAFRKKNEDWSVHSHFEKGELHHQGVHFLAWHRVFLNAFENRLRREVPGVTLPYWNALLDPVPAELKRISDNESERVGFGSQNLHWFGNPGAAPLDFEAFQLALELGYHNTVHFELGRRKFNPIPSTMGRRRSPRDGVFWLHHAFVDMQWGHWSQKSDGASATNPNGMIKGDEIVKGKRVDDVLHTSQLGYVYDNGIYNNIKTKGSSGLRVNLEKNMVLSAKLPGEERYYSLWVVNLSDVAAFITVQDYPNCIPGSKFPLWPSRTMYCDLRSRKLDVSADIAHLRITKSTSGSTTAYTLEAKNGLEMAEFNGITDFTAGTGGALDPKMLYI